jgi:predicted Zn-dependent protease
MQNYFYELADYLQGRLQGNEIYLAHFEAEDSDFARFNQAKARQAGSVAQRYLTLDLVDGQRHSSVKVSLEGEVAADRRKLDSLLEELRGRLPYLSDDPYLLYATEIHNSEQHGANRLPPAQQAVAEILDAAQGLDFVGIYAAGGIYTGFANSLGQRNWHSSHSFNLGWSLYHAKDKAVKSAYAGFAWEPMEFLSKLAGARAQLDILKQPPRPLQAGQYRVYLAPAAMWEIFEAIGDSVGLKAQRAKQSSLLHMLEGGKRLHPMVNLAENTADGVAPAFQAQGFVRPPRVPLIEGGQCVGALVSPRSAGEYGVAGNGANQDETPEALEVAGGELAQADILKSLYTGIYINNLWYLNYSDRAACRLTGMTRFATFWVEQGEIVAPLNVMRFDETLYRILGEKLLGLTTERDWILSASTYDKRASVSARLPGALVDDFTLTL